MSKIICDVCGTAYPDTAEQCPICGSARDSQEEIVSDDSGNTAKNVGHQYVRGGRFSKSNVKKRNRGSRKAAPGPVEKSAPREPAEKEMHRSNRGLVITALILLLAIIAMVTFIFLRFFYHPGGGMTNPTDPYATSDPAVTDSTATESTVPQETGVACTKLTVKERRIDLDAPGRAWLLEVVTEPANTTDTVSYASADEKIATVSQQGRITAVGAGQTVITVTCGTQTVQCSVACDFNEETDPTAVSDPTEETEAPVSGGSLELSHSDVTLAYKGEAFTITADGISGSEIRWSVGNTNVATVSGGKVTAVGPGMTIVTAEYNGRRAACIVRCGFEDTEEAPENGGDQPEGGCTISHTDVTLSAGETFTLTLRDSSGEEVSVSWNSGDEAVCTVSGGAVTGVAEGSTQVSATYDGVTYTCIVRVH